MDLGAYEQIDELEKIAWLNGIDIPRVRGYRLMEHEEKISEEEIQKIMKQAEIATVKWLCEAVPFWDPNSCISTFDAQREVLMDFYLVGEDTGNGWKDYTDIRWDRIHGKKRKILKFEIKKIRKAIRKQYDIWNKYAGQKDVLYIHSRMGGNNWKWYEHKKDITDQSWFLERVDDFWDSTYCDFYARIKDEPKHSCYDCEWECLDGCSLRRDENGRREPIYDEPVYCVTYLERCDDNRWNFSY